MIEQFCPKALPGKPQKKVEKETQSLYRVCMQLFTRPGDDPESLELVRLIINRLDRLSQLCGASARSVLDYCEQHQSVSNIPLQKAAA